VTRFTKGERESIGMAGNPLPAASSVIQVRGLSRDTVWRAETRF